MICWTCKKEYEEVPLTEPYKCECGGYVVSPSGKVQGKWVDESPPAKQDRLEAARVKIAKARFSPERLVGESAVYGNDCPGGRCEF